MVTKGTSDFLSTFKTKPKLLEKAKAMKDAKDPNARPEIPDGNYIAKFTSSTVGARKEVPFVKFRFTVTRGPYTGTVVPVSFDLGIGKPDPKRSAEEEDEFLKNIFDRFAVVLQRMEVKTKVDSPDAILAAVQEAEKLAPTMDLTIRTSARGYLNVFVNRKVEDEKAPPANDDEADEIPDDDEALEVVSEDEAPEEEASEEDLPVEVGDVVRYKPKGAQAASKFTVTKSDPEKRTCSLKNQEGGVVKGVSWDAVQFVLATD